MVSAHFALALYKRAPNGQIIREYPLDQALAQLFGSDRGDPGLERALFGVQSGAAPEAFDVVREHDIKLPANLDVRLTIDGELQKAVVGQLRDRHGAVVILNPQTGEVLAMYSNPAYSLNEVKNDSARWMQLDADKRDSPLVNQDYSDRKCAFVGCDEWLQPAARSDARFCSARCRVAAHRS